MNKRIFGKVASNPKVGSIEDCNINMPTPQEMEEIMRSMKK